MPEGDVISCLLYKGKSDWEVNLILVQEPSYLEAENFSLHECIRGTFGSQVELRVSYQ